MRTIIQTLVYQLTQPELVQVISNITNDIAVINAIDIVLSKRENAWQDLCRQAVANGKRVTAVKTCRDATGWTLKESLDFVTENFPRPVDDDDGIPF